MDTNPVNPLNPLSKHFRQPAIYFKLPSNGKFWADGSLNMPVTGDLAVYPMTARNEITLRTPDALLNGQGIIDVIQSCIPAVINAWKMPSIDVDACLIAIRIASYGAGMDVETKCPHCNEEHAYAVQLDPILAGIKCPDYSKKLGFDGIQVKLAPQSYFSINETDQIRFEEQRIIQALTDESVSEEQRIAEYSKHMQKIVDLNLKILVDSTEYIEVDGEEIVTDKKYITEFYNNCETKIINTIQTHLGNLLKETKLPSVNTDCTACKKSFTIPLSFDYANFFASGS